MSKLLYIEASPRKARSKSILVANAFLEAYRAAHPSDQVVTLDLWDKALPEFDGFTIDAKYQVMNGKSFTQEQQTAWNAVVALCDEFKDADKYVMSLPMWNFGIPYKLKHYIDLIAQPGQTFSFSPETGYSGLVTGKPIVTIYARGGSYSAGGAQGMDYQTSYLEMLLGFIGFKDIRSIVIEPTMGSPEHVATVEEAAKESAKEIAKKF